MGWSLVQIGAGGFYATRWDRPVELEHLAAVEAFLRRIGSVR
jgi:hypothetical protein